MELLAPAGDREALEAAVRGGADAVYLGLTTLNARRGAGNFDADALKAACEWCHERDVKVHVTVNILVKNEELGELERAARALADAGADAAIVQDLGAARALRQMLPELSLHASTQMAIHNRQGVRFLKENGFARAVLAREMRYEEIAGCAAEGMEIEVFGHGALCVACSGQCLFSSMVGGRSGNRGLCAQPCRLPYRLDGPLCNMSGDLLSPKDLRTIENLKELEKAGACSIKLEGRLKSADYVYRVTSLYRLALDGERVDERLLSRVFNRGYTKGYGPGVNDSELMSLPSEKHVEEAAGDWPAPGEKKTALSASLTAHVGQPLTLTLTDGNVSGTQTGGIVEPAEKKADPERMTAQIKKTGGVPYRIDDIALDIDEDAFIAVSALNGLRRAGIEQIGSFRAEKRRAITLPPNPLHLPDVKETALPGKPLLCVQSGNAHLLEKALDWGADEIVWAPDDVTREGLDRAPDSPFTLRVPKTLDGDCLDSLNKWANNQNGKITGTVLTNPAHLVLNWPGNVRAGAAMNVFNDLSADFLDMPYMPSPELTAQQIRQLPGEKELPVYGRLTLMLLRHCPLNHALGGARHSACRRCDVQENALNRHALIDRKGVRFPLSQLKTDTGCLIRVYNSVPLMLLRHVRQLPPAARWRVVLTDEDELLAKDVVACHRMALDGEDLTGSAWEHVSGMASTTGHYFRGVE